MGHEAEVRGGGVSFIWCQGRFQEGLRGPRIALAVCEALVK